MVAGTAAAVGVALVNERRLFNVLVDSSTHSAGGLAHAAAGGGSSAAVSIPQQRPSSIARRFAFATACAAAVFALIAALPVMMAFATSLGEAAPLAARQGPPAELRAAAGLSGGSEQAYHMAVPAADAVGAAVLAGNAELERRSLIDSMQQIWVEQQAQAAANPPKPVPVAAPPVTSSVAGVSARPGTPATLNGASGYAPGTIVRARITVYGCTGPGGGFCGNMASGIRVFEGAAACSRDMAFGTRIRIIGDPTGRVYECLDRGALKTTWVDVFFNNTSDGIRWASLLGGTSADIEIVN